MQHITKPNHLGYGNECFVFIIFNENNNEMCLFVYEENDDMSLKLEWMLNDLVWKCQWF